MKFASQIMISYAFDPPEDAEVKRSYATFATIELLVDWVHFHVVYTTHPISAPRTHHPQKGGDLPGCSRSR